MKTYTFTIEGRLLSMNEIIELAKKGRGKYQPYAEAKRNYTNYIAYLLRRAPKFKKPSLKIVWYEKNKKRDMDGITAGKKFILDGMVTAGVIKDDSRKYINDIHDIIEDDPKNPRIVVTLIEGGE